MSKDIVTAGVNINVSGGISGRTSGKINSGGSSSTDKLLKSLLGEFKTGNRIADGAAKKLLSGFGGKAAGGVLSGTGAALGLGAAGVVAGIGGLTALAGSADKSAEGSFAYFEKAIIDGEEKVVKMDQITGKVTEVLTTREAIERGIMDGAKNIKLKYSISTKAIEDNIKKLEKQGDYLVIGFQQKRLKTILKN